MCVCLCVCVCVCACVYIYISKLKVISTTPTYRGEHYSFPWMAPLTLDWYIVMLNVRTLGPLAKTLYIYIYIYIILYTHKYIYIYICTRTHTRVRARTDIYTNMK